MIKIQNMCIAKYQYAGMSCTAPLKYYGTISRQISIH